MVGSQTANLTPGFLLHITCVANVQMVHARPFLTFTLQDLSNYITIISRQGVLTPAIELWIFESLGGLPSPHFESVSDVFTLLQSGVVTLLVLRWTTGNLDAQVSPWPEFERSRHLPPYSIFCASPQGPHLNGFLSHDSQMGVLKFSQLGLPQLWRCITSCADFWLQQGLRQSYSLVEIFPTVCRMLLAHKEIGSICDF
jgi:hypothetical protein